MKGIFLVMGTLMSAFFFNTMTAVVIIGPERLENPQALRGPRVSSFPYISGDTFRAACDFIIDEKQIPFDTDAVKDGDAIFLKTDLLSFFFKEVHPHIKKQ